MRMAQNKICQNSCVLEAKPVAVLLIASMSLDEVIFYASMIHHIMFTEKSHREQTVEAFQT